MSTHRGSGGTSENVEVMLLNNPPKTETQIDVWFFHNMSVTKKLPFFNIHPWSIKWISWEDELGYSNTLMLELGLEKLKDYINVILLFEGWSEHFLEQVAPFIQWQNTKMWDATCNDTRTNVVSHGTGASHAWR